MYLKEKPSTSRFTHAIAPRHGDPLEITHRAGHPQLIYQLLQGEAKRLATPRDLDLRPWDDLDFLGWRDPGAPDRSYLVTERAG